MTQQITKVLKYYAAFEEENYGSTLQLLNAYAVIIDLLKVSYSVYNFNTSRKICINFSKYWRGNKTIRPES